MNIFRLDAALAVQARKPLDTDSRQLSERVRAAWERGEALGDAGDVEAGLAWLERAHRLAPSDQNLVFSLAMMRLRAGRAAGAITLFEAIAQAHGIREAWAALAAACLADGQTERAATALAAGLQRNMADAGLLSLAARIASVAGLPGWCALTGDGLLRVSASGTVKLTLDGRAIKCQRTEDGTLVLPEAWRHTATLTATIRGAHLPGSPMGLAGIMRVEGFVARMGDQAIGWAWHPGAPEIDPEIWLADEQGGEIGRAMAGELAGEVEGSSPLARPRSFAMNIPQESWVSVRSNAGGELLGGPLGPTMARRLPRAGSGDPAPLQPPARRPGTDIVIPIYRGIETTLACLRTVLATTPPATRIWLVDDASPEAALVIALKATPDDGRVSLIASCASDPKRNLGFPASVNAGLAAAAGRDVVLLNSDTLVAGDWLAMLEDAAYAVGDIGTATPLSNNATILSYPEAGVPNPPPDEAGTEHLATLAAASNAGLIVEIPTAHGFCMFIRHDCLHAAGGFEEGLFAQGYGEENDFSERARALGWRHVAVPGAYVAHVGGVSFGAGRMPLLRRNLDVLGRLHPGYHSRIATFMAGDALAPARRRLDAARWREGRSGCGAVLLVSHGGGGGTARIVAERAAAIRARGQRPVVLTAKDGLCAVGEEDGGFPNLRFRLPAELPALLSLLEGEGCVSAELHHLLGHDHSVTRLFAVLGIPYAIWVHDYAWLCPRISLVAGTGRYCGEPPATSCEICVRRWGRAIEDPVSPTALRARSAADLAGGAAVIVATEDAARRLRRHFPGIIPRVEPWEDDCPASPALAGPRSGRLLVAVIGGIGVEKGYDVLLACAEDAAARGLDLAFTIIGYSTDDDRLEATGRVFITGPFEAAEAEALIRAQHARLAFLPSIWPETWCYALSDAWQAGLSAAVFDIGAPAERVRKSGRGWVLPLGLPPTGINDYLLRLANA